MGQTGVVKLHILSFWLLSILLLLLEHLNPFGGNRKPYEGSLESWSGLTPAYRSKLGHKITDFVFLVSIPPTIAFRAFECFGTL